MHRWILINGVYFVEEHDPLEGGQGNRVAATEADLKTAIKNKALPEAITFQFDNAKIMKQVAKFALALLEDEDDDN
jgi:hypothetical protein